MRPQLAVLKTHKWLALLIGVQMLLWAASGVYMVMVHIDTIHGDMLVAEPTATLDEHLGTVVPMATLLQRYPQANQVRLKLLAGVPVFQLGDGAGSFLVDASSGTRLGSLDEARVRQLASARYTGDAPVKHSELIADNPPGEVKHLALPAWRVDFDDHWGSSFYIDPVTGELLTRRHNLWRVFDFLWMLHIMDYESRDRVNTLLLRLASPLALLLLMSGGGLLYFRFRRRRRV